MRTAALVLWLAVALWPAVALPAQEPAQRFDAAMAALRTHEWAPADREALAAAAAAAWRAFLQLPPGAERDARRAAAVGAALHAGEATAAIELAAQLPAPEAEVITWTGRARLRRGEFAAFRDAVQRARDTAQDLAPWHRALLAEEALVARTAERLLRTDDQPTGLWCFEELSRSVPDDPIRLANLALSYRNLGRFDDAERCYRRAVDLDPSDVQIRSDLGLCLRAAGRWRDAIAVLLDSCARERTPGEGPGATNLLQMAVLRPAEVEFAPWAMIEPVLRLRPATAMPRRLALDHLLQRTPRRRDDP